MALCVAELLDSDAPQAPVAAQFVVAAFSESDAGALRHTVGDQRWPGVQVVYPVAAAVSQAMEAGAHAVFMVPGTVLAPMALESAWWALDTRPDIGFVVFGDERGAATPMLEAIVACTVVRGTLLRACSQASHAHWPGIAPVLALLELGVRGHLIREPLVTRMPAARQLDAPGARAVSDLRSKGLADALLGDPGHDTAPSPLPLQQLDERPLPPARRANEAHSLRKGKHRVLVLLQGFPMGGYTAFNADFLPRLVQRGHAVTVCTTEAWRSEWRLDQARAATADIMHAGGIVPLPSLPRYVSYLIESRQIDVVLVSHSLAGYRMLPWLRRQHLDTAFVDYVHTEWFETNMYGSYAALGAAHADWLDVQVATSRSLATALVRAGAREDTTRAQTINLDVHDWNPARFHAAEIRTALNCKAGQPLILLAGRLSGEKRPLLAVACWKALVAAGVDARFAVAGNGPLLAPMIDAVAAAGLTERVEFLGELEGDMLRYVFSAADVYHAPSEIEGIARSLYEAMAMQCIPVVADVGGQRELVSPECGVLVPHGPNEVLHYADAMMRVLASGNRQRMQRASRERIMRNFTSAQCVAGFEAAFKVAVAHRVASASVPAESHAAARELALAGLETMRRHYWRAHRQ